MTSKTDTAIASTPANDIRPTVARRPSNIGVWVFGAAIVVTGTTLFATLDANRRAISAPTTKAQGADYGSIGSQIPSLQLPYDDQPNSYGLVQYPPVQVASQQPNSLRVVTERESVSPRPSIFANREALPPAQPASNVLPPLTGNAGVVFDTVPPEQSIEQREASKREEGSVTKGPERVKAGRLTNPADTIVQGSIIQAVLETALDSTRAGLARAIVSREVRGFDGNRVLVPRGSRLVGEYQSDVSAGQNRALVIWTRLIRPDGVTINLQSPAADALGRAGIRGKVNSHFFERFGGAILQSALDIGVGLGTRRIAGGTVIVGLPGSTTSLPRVDPNATTEIKPTVTVKQGASVSVFVARDLDFSSVSNSQ